MADKKTVRKKSGTDTDPVSRVESRVISRGTAINAELDGRMILARRILTAFVLDSKNTPPKLKSEFDITDVGKLSVTSVENLSLNDDKEEENPSLYGVLRIPRPRRSHACVPVRSGIQQITNDALRRRP